MTESTLPLTPPPANAEQAPAQKGFSTKESKQKATESKITKPSKKSNIKLVIGLIVAIVTCVLAMLSATYVYRLERNLQQAAQDQADQIQTYKQELQQQLSSQTQVLQNQLKDVQDNNQQLFTAQQVLREQVNGLERSLQGLTANGGEAALLQMVEQLVDMAHQQLTLASNVGQALIALETAQARLARASFPRLTPLQQAVNGDLERLRALPTQDLAQLADKLDQLQQLLMQAPLLADAAPAETVIQTVPATIPTQAASPANSEENIEENAQNGWHQAWDFTRRNAQQAWQALGHELRQLVSIRRIDDPAALLLSPEQATQLREHLRMRVMMARLALMTAQTPLWQAEMQAMQDIIQTHYDLHTPTGLRVLALTEQLSQSPITLDPPRDLNSRQAIQTLLADLQSAPAAVPDDGGNGVNDNAPPPEASETPAPVPTTPEAT